MQAILDNVHYSLRKLMIQPNSYDVQLFHMWQIPTMDTARDPYKRTIAADIIDQIQ